MRNTLQLAMFRTCVSLLPAATQMILDMGLADSLRGVTHFCPPQAQKRCPVLLRIQDGQAHLQVSTIQELQPDVIFTQSTCQACLMDEEELKNQLVGMAEPVRTLSLDPLRLEEVFGAALQIADALGWPEQGKAYVEALRRRVDQIAACLQKTPFSRCRVGFLEWLDPVFHAGHWIPDQICLAGGVDPLAKPGQKSEPIPWESVVASDPEVLLLSPCGCTMEEICEAAHGLRKLRGWSHLRAVRAKRVYVVEPNLYTQPSASSLVEGMELLAHLLHPEVFPHDGNGPTRFIRFAS